MVIFETVSQCARCRPGRGFPYGLLLLASFVMNITFVYDMFYNPALQKSKHSVSVLTRGLQSAESLEPRDDEQSSKALSSDLADTSEQVGSASVWKPPITETDWCYVEGNECTSKDDLAPRMACTGSNLAARTCYFQDLLWDVKLQKFVFYDRKYSSLPFYTDRQQLQENEPWIFMSREVTNASNSEFWRPDQFYMDWRVGQEPPSTEDVVESPYPAVHLRTILSLHSIGHFIRDNLAPLTSVPTRFGVDPTEFTWVLWPSISKGQTKWNQTNQPLLNHYRSWLPQAASTAQDEILWPTWNNVLDEALEENSDAKYIRFRKVLAGRGSTAHDSQIYMHGGGDKMWSRWAHTCEPEAWRRMRDIAKLNVQAPNVGTSAASMTPLVLILDGQPETEKRMFANAEAAATNLRRALPNIEVQVTRISELSGPDQLTLLSRTTVLISNIGSRSFRLLFLPDGAQAILVGFIEEDDDDADGPPALPFKESNMCWDFIGYVNVWRYHVKNNVELASAANIPPEGREAFEFESHRDRAVYWRDQDIVLQPQKLLKLVETALANVRDWKH